MGNEETLAKLRQIGPGEVKRRAVPCGLVQTVVGERDEGKEGKVGREVAGEGLASGVGFLEFADNELGP